jgi:hypothetical protein
MTGEIHCWGLSDLMLFLGLLSGTPHAFTATVAMTLSWRGEEKI